MNPSLPIIHFDVWLNCIIQRLDGKDANSLLVANRHGLAFFSLDREARIWRALSQRDFGVSVDSNKEYFQMLHSRFRRLPNLAELTFEDLRIDLPERVFGDFERIAGKQNMLCGTPMFVGDCFIHIATKQVVICVVEPQGSILKVVRNTSHFTRYQEIDPQFSILGSPNLPNLHIDYEWRHECLIPVDLTPANCIQDAALLDLEGDHALVLSDGKSETNLIPFPNEQKQDLQERLDAGKSLDCRILTILGASMVIDFRELPE